MKSFKNIAIIKMRHLGDVLTTTPLIGGIRKAWPEARISYIVSPGCEDLVRYHPDVHEVLAMPRDQGLARQVGFVLGLRRRRFDLALELSWGDRGAFVAWGSGAPVRVGYRPKHRKLLDRRRLFTHLVTTKGSSKHTVEFHLDALRVLGVEPGYQPLSLHWPDASRERVGHLLSEAGLGQDTPYAVVHPSSRWMFKAWRPDGNAEVIDYLREKAGLAVVLTSAPEKKELAFVQSVRSLVRTGVVDLTGRLSLLELAALISGARLFFGVDSLPMHMAAAVGTPAVALFGPSGEHMWSPWGEGHQVVSKDWECRPCGRDGCNGTKVSRCLVEIKAADVYPALDRALGQGQ
jgi:heptosyltransferase-3